ncbi:MAG: cytochrome c, partial [Vicinamibacteria bacterium]
MKSKFVFALVLTAAFGACAPKETSTTVIASGTASGQDGGDGQRLVSLVDYVSADYGGAVSNGQILSPFEYEEQLQFLETATALASRATRDPADQKAIAEHVNALREAVLAKADVAVVASLGRAAREELLSRLGLRTMPLRRPNLTNAEALFTQSCVACHGTDGLGQTEVAAQLDPKPTSFKNEERRNALSPYRVYNALTLGVPGTAMPAFDSLSPTERWDLAFYVLRLGHAGEPSRGPVS